MNMQNPDAPAGRCRKRGADGPGRESLRLSRHRNPAGVYCTSNRSKPLCVARLAGDVGITRPVWAEGDEAQQLAALLLAAACNGGNAEDCLMVGRLAGQSYADVDALAARWRSVPDPPIRRVLTTWEFVSPLDAWSLLHSVLTNAQVDAFESVIVEVLSENDSALDLPAKERFMGAMQGKRLKYSDALRRGLAGRCSAERRAASSQVPSPGGWRSQGHKTRARSWPGSGRRCTPPSRSALQLAPPSTPATVSRRLRSQRR